jgi:hypothetical protein
VAQGEGPEFKQKKKKKSTDMKVNCHNFQKIKFAQNKFFWLQKN